MGKKIKKGTQGPIKEYVSRSKAIKKLQLTLKDFRRLCILKGIYPREPPQSLKKQHKTYYHVKDVSYLKGEAILEKFREKRSHIRRIRRAIARGDKLKARRLFRVVPQENLDHLVRERYPTFIDALNDLDDPLCLISLFASFHAHKELHIPNSLIQSCDKLLKQFLLYVATHHCLRKVFLSIKGIYYQAIVQGATVTWIMPYPIQASLPLDVDYKVMTTFLEFYQVLMRFVNFKLLGQELEVSDIGQTYRILSQQSEKADVRMEVDENFKEDPTLKQINEQYKDQSKYGQLFKGLKFYLYPEVPKQSLEFVILSLGGDVCWAHDSRGTLETDPQITHVITERVVQQNKKRDYIQPQWVYDSVNSEKLLSTLEYGPDKTLPPHLSPFEETPIEDLLSEIEDEEKINQMPAYNRKDRQREEERKKKLQSKENLKLAETMLTKKNKRLYQMVKRKEDEQNEKNNKLVNKRKQLNIKCL